ncbi:hypothetical protein [Hyphomicrobium sp.]|uniref:hypothetical protein n=1 Tax=Hyphomicrobium sp. TaxID=82 RepID=UPI0025BAABA6|nr:hypothetical protein [Hyphomicrobium sp.]MCC7253058.1 hypothetical protein [Hyphomicrobium sp.]
MDDAGKLTDLEKVAIDSVIKRQQSLLDLMRHTDIRSQQLTIAYAGFMGAGLLFVARDPAIPVQFGALAALSMLGYALSLALYSASVRHGMPRSALPHAVATTGCGRLSHTTGPEQSLNFWRTPKSKCATTRRFRFALPSFSNAPWLAD